MFVLSCPRCHAVSGRALLEVIAGTFRAGGLYLSAYGFATMDAKSFDTDNEMIYCHACKETFALDECIDPES